MARDIRAVFFDLDDTLHDESPDRLRLAVRRTCAQWGGLNGLPPADRLAEAYLTRSRGPGGYWASNPAGPNDEQPRRWSELNTEIWSQTLKECGADRLADPAKMSAAYFRERLQGLQLFDDSLEVLRELGPRYALGLITNGQSDLQRAKLVKLRLGPYFPVTVISGEVGFGKPSQEVFAYAAERAGVGVDESAHVGDSIPRDVVGARAAGMRAIWLNRGGADTEAAEAQPDHVVASLREVAALLQR